MDRKENHSNFDTVHLLITPFMHEAKLLLHLCFYDALNMSRAQSGAHGLVHCLTTGLHPH